MKTKFILYVVIVIILVIGLGVFMNKSSGPSKYDDFAQNLKTKGAVFYGAFWCPHCLAEKTLFGNAKKYLPYVECSNPDQTPTQICIDKKVESYPTWMFKDGITVNSKDTPTICEPRPGKEGEPEICGNIPSKLFKTWIFPGERFSVKSNVDPIKTGDIWKFDASSQAVGEIPLEFLAQQIGYTLPK